MSLNKAISKLSEDDFLFILKNGKRTSVLNGFDFEDLIYFSFRFVKQTLPNLLKIGNFDKIIYEAFKDRGQFIFEVDVNFYKANECMSFILWLRDEIEIWNLNEQNYLSSEPDINLLGAGINELSKFGNLNIIDSLAGGDITKHEQIWNMKYGDIFDMQWKKITETNIQKKLSKVKPKTK